MLQKRRAEFAQNKNPPYLCDVKNKLGRKAPFLMFVCNIFAARAVSYSTFYQMITIFSTALCNARKAIAAILEQLDQMQLPALYQQQQAELQALCKAFLSDVKAYKLSKKKKQLQDAIFTGFAVLQSVLEQFESLQEGQLGVVEFFTKDDEPRSYLCIKTAAAKAALYAEEGKSWQGGRHLLPMVGFIAFPYVRNGLFYEFEKPAYKVLKFDKFKSFAVADWELCSVVKNQFPAYFSPVPTQSISKPQKSLSNAI